MGWGAEGRGQVHFFDKDGVGGACVLGLGEGG